MCLHTKGMTRAPAIKYRMDNEPISEQGATAEIEGCLVSPGQDAAGRAGGEDGCLGRPAEKGA
ncbi:hypothetical protein [Hymenobacter sp. BT730]|uniref:hypothetical protein n=1 Tax=Hymenobacter sp. BT730 TaxID=3063332 RepID=UPI0026DFC6E0|nr:hypothetical protein [Hymenobacter sp. BT730]